MNPQEITPRRGLRMRDKFLRFVLVGVVATAIHYCVLIACVELLDWDPVPASGLGFALSAGVNYGLNRQFTFQSNATHRRAVFRFAVVILAGLGWTLLLMHVFTARMGFGYLFAQVITTGIVLLWNFGGNALWSFAPAATGSGKP